MIMGNWWNFAAPFLALIFFRLWFLVIVRDWRDILDPPLSSGAQASADARNRGPVLDHKHYEK